MTRFEVLYEGYCDGTLTLAERDEFLALLKDPAQRARFVELSTFEAVVTDELGVARSQDKASSGKMRAVRAARRARFSSATGFPAWLAASIAAAALLLLALFGSAVGPKPVKPAPPEPRKDVEAKAAPEKPTPLPEKPSAPVREQRDPEPLVVPPPAPAPAPEPPKPAPPKETPKPKPPTPTIPKEPEKETFVAVALVEAAQGRVLVAGEPAAAGRGLRSGEAVETGPGAAAWIKFPDGTLLIVGPDSLAKVADTQGKHVQLDKGLVDVDAPKQSRPMVVAGPHAEATVLGTEFTVSTAAGYTRLDVREGRVRFARGVSSVVVTGGQWAMATPGQDLMVKSATSLWKAPPAGLLGWYKAELIKAGVKGAASSWLDHSGAGRHAVQPGPVSQPLVVEGGHPALRFDGADDFLEMPSGISDFRGGVSAFVVAKMAPGPTAMRIFDLGAEVACDNIVLGKKDGNLAFWALVKSESRGRVEAPAILPEQWAIYSVVAQSTGRAALYRNGALVGAGSTSQVTGPPRKYNIIGKAAAGGEPFRGELAELLLYQRALGDVERQYIDAYLWAKHLDPSLPVPLPKKP
ncbi:MAG TPA: FecR domain-containing protein [Planctomycetota bacterium]